MSLSAQAHPKQQVSDSTLHEALIKNDSVNDLLGAVHTMSAANSSAVFGQAIRTQKTSRGGNPCRAPMSLKSRTRKRGP
jgi:hypothetical protein